MYKAIKKIGEYNVGDEVPTDKAIIWLNMYVKPHVEKVGGETIKAPEKVEKSEPEVEATETSNNVMLDDYIGRNTETVVKSIKEDKLPNDTLKSLLKLEKSDKNRKEVIKAIQKKLKN